MMEFYEAAARPEGLIHALCRVWERSVRATHTFLDEAEIRRLSAYVPGALREVPLLVVARDSQGEAAGFMGIDAPRLEMLFLEPGQRGKGYGRRLVQAAASRYGVTEVCVNEQNPQARGFYERMGFRVYHRSACDGQGAPYPLLYLRLPKP
ncbi:GNAT family N-acetyltransferase [Intestinibacillus massiliensis]|uniref:GNAT family N-acetyltransferase n=1 Tax=Intestinibacillus massiliensis TaxID=1871029 RepID=UPI001F24100C|nr:GNAT family N-acetyltransferase [Intestinibacillus massiliensis]